jgi:hypothetical protein
MRTLDKKAYPYKHEYKDYIIIWDSNRLLYRVSVKSGTGKLPTKLKGLYFNKPTEAIRAIETYLTNRPVRKSQKKVA